LPGLLTIIRSIKPGSLNKEGEMNEHERAIFIQGALEGIRLFSWMKDGVSYVGTCGKTFKEAKKELLEGKYDGYFCLEVTP
jgi:hypothetical protein